MTRKLHFLGAFAALVLLATGCSKEASPIDQNTTGDQQGFIQLTLSSKAAPQSRAAGQNSQTAEPEEMSIDESKGLTVVVFSETGVLEFAGNVDMEQIENDVYQTLANDPITVNAGNLHFFVFANNDETTQVQLPAPGTTMEQFMTSLVNVAYDAYDTPDIAIDDEFLLGSMWRQTTLTPAGGTATTPIVVEIPAIGRLSAKVLLGAVDLTVNSAKTNLTGAFAAANFRIGTVANAINAVGVHTGNLLPYTPNTGVLVTSAKHTAPYEVAGAFNTADYKQYLGWKPYEVATANDEFFYVTENTTGRDAVTGQQYYGNTSYIQIETVYTPLFSELKEIVADAGEASGFRIQAYTGADVSATFWSTGSGMTRLIFKVEPTPEQLDALGLGTAYEYTDGKNYHKFVIFDTDETDAVIKNRVLRNHHYTFDITGISDLGDWTSEVDPEEPVVEPTTIQVKVSIANWDKVATGGVEL